MNLSDKNKENISDGYHNFKELYEHRHVLFIALCLSNPSVAWKSLKHSDGTDFSGWFIAGIELPAGQITYHLPIAYWEQLHAKTLDTAPEWDGHSSRDVIMRLSNTPNQFWQQQS